RANGSVFLPRTKRQAEEGSLDLTDQLSPHTLVGASGSFSQVRYSNLLGNAQGNLRLIDNRAVHGRGFITHEISRSQSLGATYDFQDLAAPKGHVRTETHSWGPFYELKIKPNMKLTVFGGPEYSRQHDQVEINNFFFTIELPFFRT